MTDLRLLFLSALAGAGLGWFFYQGLWLTVRRLPSSSRPHRLLLASFVVRMTVVMTGLYLCAGLGPIPFVTALAAFFLVRFLLVDRTKKTYLITVYPICFVIGLLMYDLYTSQASFVHLEHPIIKYSIQNTLNLSVYPVIDYKKTMTAVGDRV